MEQKKQLPRDVYRADGIYEFKVRKLFATYCEVIDESTGIATYLHGTGIYDLHLLALRRQLRRQLRRTARPQLEFRYYNDGAYRDRGGRKNVYVRQLRRDARGAGPSDRSGRS